MAFRATGYLRPMLNRLGGNRPFATSTTPKMKQFAQSAGSAQANQSYNKFAIRGEYVPIYMVLGMCLVAVTIATHSLKQQLAHCPNVTVNKKKRRSVQEVEEPDQVVSSADKFVNKSFLRKVAHIQDNNQNLPNPTRPNPFTSPRNAETLKSAGVNPSRS